MQKHRIVVIGANSDIAKAIVKQYRKKDDVYISVISRDISSYDPITSPQQQLIELSDYSITEIEAAMVKLANKDLPIANVPISRVFLCHGILHSASIKPEKKLEDFNHESFMRIISANTLTPILWLQKLMPLISGKTPCVVTVFSARVGSINDNHLGGWYSYRASKAALNMLLKTAAVELTRRAKNVKLLAFHPGTTNTKLSQPFQKNVPANKLFSCEFVANQVIEITSDLEMNGQLSYLDWDNKEIPW